MWGHGYVRRYFDGIEGALWMKRWRCPQCRGVHTARLGTHWRKFWASWPVILLSLLSKERGGRWLGGMTRQRQQYWWRGLQRQIQVGGGGPRCVLLLFVQGVMLASHSIQDRAIRLLPQAPYPIFAATGVGPHVYAPP